MPEVLAAPTVRLLPSEEWDRLLPFEPFSQGGLPDPTHWRVVVAEVAGPGSEIVAFTCLFDAVHLEPLWVHPDYRTRPRAFYQLLGDLWQGAHGLLQEYGVSLVFAVVADQHGARGQNFVQHLGFTPAGGSLYVVSVDQLRVPSDPGGAPVSPPADTPVSTPVGTGG